MQYDAVILAGGRAPWLQEMCGTEHRCLAPLAGRRMVDYIIDALQKSGCIRRIVIATNADAIAQLEGTLPEGVSTCLSEGDMPATAYAAAMALGEDCSESILFACDDIPLLTCDGVQDFLCQCADTPGKGIYYAIIPKEACLKRFPDAKRTFGTVTDGTFTGGNLMLITKEVVINSQQLGREIFALRKSPFGLANWLGWSFILKAVFRRLSISAAEERFSQIMHTPSKAIITEYAEIGMDVDKPVDLKLIEQYLSK